MEPVKLRIDIPGVSIEISDLLAWIQPIWRIFKRPDNPFSKVKESSLSQALANAVLFLFSDRLEGNKITLGGWAKSANLWTMQLYGKERQDGSIFTTSVVVIALQAYRKLLLRAAKPEARKFTDRGWQKVLSELDKYIDPRWDNKTGCGGNLLKDVDNIPRLAPNYRHTAWILRLWLDFDKYWHNSEITANYLINSFDNVNWRVEKVTTAFSTYSALRMVLSDKQLKPLVNEIQINTLLKKLESLIISKYDYDIKGWKPEDAVDPDIGRQIYTLFLLAEMAYLFGDETSPLTSYMSEALAETIYGKWKSKDGNGISLFPSGSTDINMSCLGVSALIKKSNLTKEEHNALQNLIDSLIVLLTDNFKESQEKLYSWAIAYFLNAACQAISPR